MSVNARFLNLNVIKITVDVNSPLEESSIALYCGNDQVEFNGFKEVSRDDINVTYSIYIPSFLFGGEYYLIINNEKYFVNVNAIMNLDIIDDNFYYDGDDLGFTYSKKETTFKLWSPLASKAFVKIINRKIEEYEMKRDEKGVFVITLKGNFEKVKYLFATVINGVKSYATDPYAVSSTANGKESIVVDLTKTYKFKANKLPRLEKYTDAVIYEASIRDLTSYKNTNVVNKGKFLGLIEEGRTSNNGISVGLDLLKRLEITHLQVLPMFDFGTVDELHPSDSYNWGYDPVQYNVPEGSFSSDPDDAYARINELKQMIDKLHENGIKVNMDVVYNHMYSSEKSAFEILTPNYYFRRNPDGTLSNGSYCGNEFATERKMCSKFVVSSCKYWASFYNLDGFRFDLMGLIDTNTIDKIEKECRQIKNDIMIYGEGWNMPSVLPSEKRATMDNAKELPNVGYFNDVFRNVLKGSSFADQPSVGYFTGGIEFIEGFKYAFLGSVVNYLYHPKFINANQTINYIECHDNETIFDKVDELNKLDTPREKQKRVSLINQVVLLSFGVPFIHMGQEVGLSKFGEDNTYNKGDRYNQYDYSILADRKWMFKTVRDSIRIRKMFPFLRLDNPTDIAKSVNFINIDNGGLIVNYINKDLIAPYKEFKILINPSKQTTYYDLKDYYQVIYNEAGILKDEMFSQSLMINPLTLVIVAKK